MILQRDPQKSQRQSAVKKPAANVAVKGASRRSVEHASLSRLKIAHGLKVARQAAALGQTEVAARAGIVRNDLSDIENGKQNVTIDMIDRLANTIGCTHFLGEHPQRPIQLHALIDAIDRTRVPAFRCDFRSGPDAAGEPYAG